MCKQNMTEVANNEVHTKNACKNVVFKWINGLSKEFQKMWTGHHDPRNYFLIAEVQCKTKKQGEAATYLSKELAVFFQVLVHLGVQIPYYFWQVAKILEICLTLIASIIILNFLCCWCFAEKSADLQKVLKKYFVELCTSWWNFSQYIFRS